MSVLPLVCAHLIILFLAILQRLRANSSCWKWDCHFVSLRTSGSPLPFPDFPKTIRPAGVDFPGYYNDNTPGIVYNVRDILSLWDVALSQVSI